MRDLKLSIAICTLNRADSLDITLQSLCRLSRGLRDLLEVVVINGPSSDNTEDIIRPWQDSIKYVRCEEANLSKSRNIGIDNCSGDIIAFLDDDSIPEPDWLKQLVPAYSDSCIGGAGGHVFDFNGFQYQAEYELIDRFANPIATKKSTPQWSFPNSPYIPHLLGANCSFRANALREVGGFDEEFEYFLDESDVALKIIDAGYKITQLNTSFVHHKSRPSGIRNKKKVPTNRYPLIKNKIYFIGKHCSDAPKQLQQHHINVFIEKHDQEAEWAFRQELISQSNLEDYKNTQKRKAIHDGWKAVTKAHKDFNLTKRKFNLKTTEFLNFPYFLHPEAIRVVLISKQYPRTGGGGIAKFTRNLAKGLSKYCHVHVFTESNSDCEYIDFIDNTWVHYLKQSEKKSENWAQKENISLNLPNHQLQIPSSLKAWSLRCLEEYQRLSNRLKIDIIESPIWDSEGIVFAINKSILGGAKLITSLHTTVLQYKQSNPLKEHNDNWMNNFFKPAYECEKYLLQNSDGIRANSKYMANTIQGSHLKDLCHPILTEIINHGIDEMEPREDFEIHNTDFNLETTSHPLKVLFVGRLERRKGIDILYKAIEEIFKAKEADKKISFKIVGEEVDHDIIEDFINKNKDKRWFLNINHLGKISEAELANEYNNCDLFVAPSRFESFGLIYLEAMSQGKPVIGCDVGGVPEIIKDGHNGYIIPNEDYIKLAERIMDIYTSREVGIALGKEARVDFLENFSVKNMSLRSLALYSKVIDSFQENIVIAHSILAKYDGISNIILDNIVSLLTRRDIKVSFIGYRCDYPYVNNRIVTNKDEFISSELVQDASKIIFHYGVYYDFFECIEKLSQNVRCDIVFHNITPMELTPEKGHNLTRKSFQTLEYCKYAASKFAISAENAEILSHNTKIDPSTIQKVGITCMPSHSILEFKKSLAEASIIKPSRKLGVNILFLGRMVQSKGLIDLLKAIELISMTSTKDCYLIKLSIITNSDFGDSEYSNKVNNLTKKINLSKSIHIAIHDKVPDYEKKLFFENAHIFILPTYHEGFGIPIVEAYANGCEIISYANSNVSKEFDEIANLVPTGDIIKLKEAIEDEINNHDRKLFACEYANRISWYRNFISSTEYSYITQDSDLLEDEERIKTFSENIIREELRSAMDTNMLKLFNALEYERRKNRLDNIKVGTQKWINLLEGKAKFFNVDKFNAEILEITAKSLYLNKWLNNDCVLDGLACRIDCNQLHQNDKNKLAWGPYVNLNTGTYVLKVYFKAYSQANDLEKFISVDITENATGFFRNLIISYLHTDHLEYKFSLELNLSEAEFIITLSKPLSFTFFKYTISICE